MTPQLGATTVEIVLRQKCLNVDNFGDRPTKMQTNWSSHVMPMNFVMEVEIFDVWGIDSMGPFVRY